VGHARSTLRSGCKASRAAAPCGVFLPAYDRPALPAQHNVPQAGTDVAKIWRSLVRPGTGTAWRYDLWKDSGHDGADLRWPGDPCSD